MTETVFDLDLHCLLGARFYKQSFLLTDGQVVFLRVLRFSPTFDERSARYKWNILERAVKPKSKKKKKKKKKFTNSPKTLGSE